MTNKIANPCIVFKNKQEKSRKMVDSRAECKVLAMFYYQADLELDIKKNDRRNILDKYL